MADINFRKIDIDPDEDPLADSETELYDAVGALALVLEDLPCGPGVDEAKV